MRHPLDDAMDRAFAAVTGPGGLLQVGSASRNGVSLPAFVGVPETLPDFFAAFCARHGAAPFLVDGDNRLSFAETYALARQVARQLIVHHGVTPGDRVAIAGRNSAAWVIGYMATILTGGIATLINGFWTSGEMADAMADVGCTLVLADDRRADSLAALAGCPPIVRYDADGPVASAFGETESETDVVALPRLTADDPATILFTSGSTGQSKGALSCQRAKIQGALNFGCATAMMLGIVTAMGQPPRNPPATLLNLPLFHVTAEVSLLLHSMIIGRKLVIMPKWDAVEAMRLIEAEKITYFVGVPLMGDEIVRHPRRAEFDLSTLTDIASGGAPRPPEHVRHIVETMPGVQPVMGYGLTETNAIGCGTFREAYVAKPASTGRPTPPLSDLAILDPAGSRLPQGAVGEICIRTIGNIDGYWNRPHETAALFTPDGYLRTGDLGYQDEDGYVFIVDRAKDIIIRGGENIACVEVEAALYRCADVLECAVVADKDDRFGEVPVAVVRPRPGATLTAEALSAHASAEIAAFKRPTRYWIWDAPLPRLGTEKIDKRALRALLQEKGTKA